MVKTIDGRVVHYRNTMMMLSNREVDKEYRIVRVQDNNGRIEEFPLDMPFDDIQSLLNGHKVRAVQLSRKGPDGLEYLTEFEYLGLRGKLLHAGRLFGAWPYVQSSWYRPNK
jgi:hypothetical protein